MITIKFYDKKELIYKKEVEYDSKLSLKDISEVKKALSFMHETNIKVKIDFGKD